MIAANFASRSKLTEFLASQLRKGRLAIFIGSGISMELAEGDDGLLMGLPNWPTLIKNLYGLQGRPAPSHSDYAKAAEEYRLEYCAGNDGLWLDSVSRALYRGADLEFETIRKNDTLGAIGALVMNSLRGAVSEVVTFNFDDVLERYLAYHGLIAIPTFEERFWANRGDIVLYHPHGFLPSPGSPFKSRSSYVVLDRRSFSERTGHSDQRMNQKMETVLQSHVCLFIGLSGDDPRLDSLMVETYDNKHAYNRSETGYWGVAFSMSSEARIARQWADRGIYLQHVVDYRNDLPKFLFEICQKAAL